MCNGLDGGHIRAQIVSQKMKFYVDWMKVESDHFQTLHWYYFDCQKVEAGYIDNQSSVKFNLGSIIFEFRAKVMLNLKKNILKDDVVLETSLMREERSVISIANLIFNYKCNFYHKCNYYYKCNFFDFY